ncbi:MAG TPA: hypothetical protein VL200_02390 [Lacunisphaera sp.]|nr:hypothetical protein [Lacunisphaera sp.]
MTGSVQSRVIAWLAAASLALTLAVFVSRGAAAWQAARVAPGIAVTSGFEEESLFALWRAARRQPVYFDPHRIPFASAYFNWLFYTAYARPVRVLADAFGDAVIPVAARAITALGALTGFFVIARLGGRMHPDRRLLVTALAGFGFLGPLVGWWAITARPDVWAMTWEAAGIVALLACSRERLGVVLSCAFFYLAWACKQTCVTGLAGALVFLAWRRRWVDAASLAGGSVGIWLMTFLALGPAYRASFQATATQNDFLIAQGLDHLTEVAIKAAPLWLWCAACLLPPAQSTAAPPDDLAAKARSFGQLALPLALVFGFVTSCKIGSAANYYFGAITPALLLVLGSGPLRLPSGALAAGLVVATGLQLASLTGKVGQLSLSPEARHLERLWSVWSRQPEPRYAAVNSLNLPWLNPASPPLVLAYHYQRDRRAGSTFEQRGVGGMIESGYFRSLLLPSQTTTTFDNGRLVHYVRDQTVDGMTVFRRVISDSP